MSDLFGGLEKIPVATWTDAEPFSLKLVDAVKALIIPFIRAADEEAPHKATGRPSLNAQGLSNNVLVDAHKPESLVKALAFALPEKDGLGREGLLDAIQQVLKYSVNTWDQGFLDKLYASTTPVRTNII